MAKHEATTTTERKIDDFAEDLGRLLGTARAKAEGWIGQRQVIVEHLSEIRDTASKLLTDLGHEVQRVITRGRPPGGKTPGTPSRGPGRPAGSGKKKRTMSAEARAKISAAQKKRWAAQKAGERKK